MVYHSPEYLARTLSIKALVFTVTASSSRPAPIVWARKAVKSIFAAISESRVDCLVPFILSVTQRTHQGKAVDFISNTYQQQQIVNNTLSYGASYGAKQI